MIGSLILFFGVWAASLLVSAWVGYAEGFEQGADSARRGPR